MWYTHIRLRSKQSESQPRSSVIPYSKIPPTVVATVFTSYFTEVGDIYQVCSVSAPKYTLMKLRETAYPHKT
jgi:hypothetical protein